jgi:hypothetical protein
MNKNEIDEIEADIGQKQIIIYFKTTEALQKFLIELYQGKNGNQK